MAQHSAVPGDTEQGDNYRLPGEHVGVVALPAFNPAGEKKCQITKRVNSFPRPDFSDLKLQLKGMLKLSFVGPSLIGHNFRLRVQGVTKLITTFSTLMT